jgi:hypothetical protein
MGKIDSTVFTALRSAENAPVTVLITCTEKCSLVKTRLMDTGVVVTAIVNDLNTLTARIMMEDVTLLEADPDILRIELDATVRAG